MNLRDTSPGAFLDKGRQKLNGRQALAYARARKTLPGGDFDRPRHQGQGPRGRPRTFPAPGRPGPAKVMTWLGVMRDEVKTDSLFPEPCAWPCSPPRCRPAASGTSRSPAPPAAPAAPRWSISSRGCTRCSPPGWQAEPTAPGPDRSVMSGRGYHDRVTDPNALVDDPTGDPDYRGQLGCIWSACRPGRRGWRSCSATCPRWCARAWPPAAWRRSGPIRRRRRPGPRRAQRGGGHRHRLAQEPVLPAPVFDALLGEVTAPRCTSPRPRPWPATSSAPSALRLLDQGGRPTTATPCPPTARRSGAAPTWC